MSGAGTARPRSQSICVTCVGTSRPHPSRPEQLPQVQPAGFWEIGRVTASTHCRKCDVLGSWQLHINSFCTFVRISQLFGSKWLPSTRKRLGDTWHPSCLT